MEKATEHSTPQSEPKPLSLEQLAEKVQALSPEDRKKVEVVAWSHRGEIYWRKGEPELKGEALHAKLSSIDRKLDKKPLVPLTVEALDAAGE